MFIEILALWSLLPGYVISWGIPGYVISWGIIGTLVCCAGYNVVTTLRATVKAFNEGLGLPNKDIEE